MRKMSPGNSESEKYGFCCTSRLETEEFCKALREAGWRLILPEIRQIVKEELQSAMGEINAKFEAVNTRIDSLSTEIKDLRESISMAQRSLFLRPK